ncbi:MAG: SDR family oxidoreductase [Bacteroidota bacterium]
MTQDNTTKVALVTGANRGIGLEIVRQLAEKGYETILTSRNAEKGKEAVEQIGLNNVYFYLLDVADAQSVAQLEQDITQRFGSLDMLINNAGINYDTWQNAVNADLDNVKETLETNLIGAWRMAQAFIPLMKQHQYGRIVNVSSGAGALNGMSGGTPGYGVSKAALNALTIKLANELSGSGILVNAVCPGWVRTEMGGSEAPRSPAQGAEGIVWAAELPDNSPSGRFFRDKKEISF